MPARASDSYDEAMSLRVLAQAAKAGEPLRTGRLATFFGSLAMLQYALVFFVIALIAAIFGFGGIAAGAVEIAKILFFIFLIVALVAAVMGLVRRR